jgi:hypothetical protein
MIRTKHREELQYRDIELQMLEQTPGSLGSKVECIQIVVQSRIRPDINSRAAEEKENSSKSRNWYPLLIM